MNQPLNSYIKDPATGIRIILSNGIPKSLTSVNFSLQQLTEPPLIFALYKKKYKKGFFHRNRLG
ncbi:MAG TPA: hypothetical protein DCR40_04625 [Prolixibacteraceae bacterium]|nr:hypothetical protein [Prolixibacteraceae bacterium]